MLTIIANVGKLYQVRDEEIEGPLRGDQMKEVPYIENAFIAIEDGKIKDFGPMSEVPERADQFYDAKGGVVMPCFVDAHTHIVYVDSREDEFVMRILGMSYEEISDRGGGILNSARKFRAASKEQIMEESLRRLDEVIRQGTGAIEIKTGYGITPEGELKALDIVNEIAEKSPIPVKRTFLGAHALPIEYRNNRKAFIDKLVNDVIPYVGSNKLADYCDVFCERGFFTPEEALLILETGLKYGLKPKVHGNQLDRTGGIQVAAQVGAVSVDHVEELGQEELNILKNSSTIPVALPTSSFFLKKGYSPMRKMIDNKLPLALASDYNPGTTPTGNMFCVWTLACLYGGITPQEAYNAMTINSAFAMELDPTHAIIRRGSVANLIVSKPHIKNLEYMPYAFGSDHIQNVFINGIIY